MDWYTINNIQEIDSPSLVVYQDRLQENLEVMISVVGGNTARLMPHIKTNKSSNVIKAMYDLGIKQFKASTIAEAELAASCGASFVLVAHQLVGPKIKRFGELIKVFPNTQFAAIIDNKDTLDLLIVFAKSKNTSIPVYIDVNNGMNRSGIVIGEQFRELTKRIIEAKNLMFRGFHVYDGHLRNQDYSDRQKLVEDGMLNVEDYFYKLQKERKDLQIICGGTPSFTSHALKKNRICSPGTCVFWDWNYKNKLPEQPFNYAVLVIARVISKPKEGIVTIDLGHKAVASENPISKRIKFLNLKNYELLSQSEEHGVLKVENWTTINVGDVLYGVPYHICPTVNLYQNMSVIKNSQKVGTWQIEASRRKITI